MPQIIPLLTPMLVYTRYEESTPGFNGGKSALAVNNRVDHIITRGNTTIFASKTCIYSTLGEGGKNLQCTPYLFFPYMKFFFILITTILLFLVHMATTSMPNIWTSRFYSVTTLEGAKTNTPPKTHTLKSCIINTYLLWECSPCEHETPPNGYGKSTNENFEPLKTFAYEIKKKNALVH